MGRARESLAEVASFHTSIDLSRDGGMGWDGLVSHGMFKFNPIHRENPPGATDEGSMERGFPKSVARGGF